MNKFALSDNEIKLLIENKKNDLQKIRIQQARNCASNLTKKLSNRTIDIKEKIISESTQVIHTKEVYDEVKLLNEKIIALKKQKKHSKSIISDNFSNMSDLFSQLSSQVQPSSPYKRMPCDLSAPVTPINFEITSSTVEDVDSDIISEFGSNVLHPNAPNSEDSTHSFIWSIKKNVLLTYILEKFKQKNNDDETCQSESSLTTVELLMKDVPETPLKNNVSKK